MVITPTLVRSNLSSANIRANTGNAYNYISNLICLEFRSTYSNRHGNTQEQQETRERNSIVIL